MLAVRVRLGILSGSVGLLPIILVSLFSWLGILSDSSTGSIALLALFMGIIIAGISSGYLAGQRRRLRSEAKIAVGATSGIATGATFGIILESFFLYRFFTTSPALRDEILTSHPIRISFTILFLGTLIVAIAMFTTFLTARPLPPPRQSTQQRPISIPDREHPASRR
jgi:hypothetical protein